MMSDSDTPADLLQLAAYALCEKEVLSQPYPDDGQVYCPPLWDDWGCWNYTLAGNLSFIDCPSFVDGFDISRQAHRYCTEGGEWWRAPNNNTWANYTTCIDLSAIEKGRRVIQLFISGYSISTLFLAIALFIFCYFKQLQCPRVTLHKNLFTSYILNSIAWILYYTMVAENATILDTNPVWCRILHVITQYFVTCNFFWMFCEGLYLHTIIVIAFTTGKKLLIGCFIIGWCLPIIPTFIYTIVRLLSQTAATRCWLDPSSLTWIIFGPIVATLIVNSLFICNIIRVLITKIRAVNSPSSTQHRNAEVEDFWKAVRAALILIPLLGIQFILFPLEPPAGTTWHHVFQMTSAFVVSFQGLFVALIFCFFNGEVISVLRRRWGQHRLMRSASVISAGSNKHRDSTFLNHTQATMLDSSPDHSPNGCLRGQIKRSGSTGSGNIKIKTKWKNPFKRSKSCDSSNGLMTNNKTEVNYEEKEVVGIMKDETKEDLSSTVLVNNVSNSNGNNTARVPRVKFGDDSIV